MLRKMEAKVNLNSDEGKEDMEVGLLATYGGRCMSTQAMQSLYDLRRNNLFCDAIIRLEDGGVFPIHRAILSACSTYFRTLFTTSLYTEEKTDVLVPGVQSDMMNHLLEYAYLRSLDVNHKNVCQLLITANYLCIFGILDLCQNYLKDNLTPENCIGVLRFAREHFCQPLESDAHTFVMRHFIEVAVKSKEILQLTFEEIQPMIATDELNVKNEECVWEFVIRWIDHDPQDRRRHIKGLMRTIRLGLLDTQYFLEKVKDHPYVTGVEECRPIIIETLRFLYDLDMITQKDGELDTPEIARPRIPHEILFALGGWKGHNATSLMETYDTRADRWIQVLENDPTGGRAYHGAAVIGFNMYVVGGFNGDEYLNSCRCFNAVTKIWREIAPMNSRRCYTSVAVLNDIIYAIGGYDGLERFKTAERYNYKDNQWSLIAPMNVRRSDASATALNNKIWITGGFNGEECINSAEYYDPDANQWTMIAPMKSWRSGLSCIAYHGCIYVIGGFNGISRMCSGEKYTPATNTWTHIPDMYNPRSNFAIEVIDDMIFAIGGYNGVSTTFHVECYDEATNEWYEATDMNMYRSGLSACVIMGLPNVNDYIHKHRESLMEEKRQKLLALEVQRSHQQNQRNNNNNIHNNEHNNNNMNINNNVNNNFINSVVNAPVILRRPFQNHNL
ncbi:kelch-like protein 10 [Cotesia glomerata]|uniref:kelch-like protein 10 n=1 Tax=Cotesia glomerata TaxID=32391 RepID=UPI001D00E291|nr:kelch-like protein 10 [Cotesia glomerata]